MGLKLYRVEVETEVYCLAESPHEAMAVARKHYDEEDPDMTAWLATSVDTHWVDGIPYHRRSGVPEKTCAEWLKELDQAG